MSQVILQGLMAVLFFLVTWAVLHRIAANVTTPRRVIKWISNKIGLFVLLKPGITSRLNDWLIKLWKPLLAIIIVAGFFPILKLPAVFFHKTFLLEAPSFLHIPKLRQDWVDFRARHLSLVGREKELAALNDFLNHERIFSWWWLNGSPGSGKSRLALEWILSLPSSFVHSRGYDAGFFRGAIDEEDWKEWQPRRSTVIVIDDAAEHVDAVLRILRILGARASQIKYPIRVLLVERSLPQSLKKLEEEQHYTECRYDAKPLLVSPLDENHLKVLAEELAAKRNKKPVLSPELEKRILDISGGRPLLMILALDSLLEYGDPQWTTHEELVFNQAQRIATKLQQHGLDKECLPLVALATLTRGLPWALAERLEPNATCQDKRLLDRLFNQDASKAIPPIQPDLLGEYFLLEQFSRITEPQRNILLKTAWEAYPERVFLTLFNLIRDFPQHPMVTALDIRPTDETAVPYWGRVRVNLLAEDCLSLDKAEHLWDDILNLAKDYPESAAVHEIMAWGAANVISVFGENHDWERMEAAFKKLSYAAGHFPDNVAIWSALAWGCANEVSYFGQNQEWYKARLPFRILQAVADRGQENRTIQIAFATASADIMSCYGNLGLWKEMRATLIDLDGLSSRYSEDPLIQNLVAGALKNAIGQYVKNTHLEEIDATFEKLQSIAARFPKNTKIQLLYVEGISDTIIGYGKKQVSAEIQEMFQILEEVAERFPNVVEIQSQLALGAYNAVDGLRRGQLWDGVPRIFRVLQEVAKRFPDQIEIQSRMAQATVNMIGFYTEKEQYIDGMQKAFKVLQEMAAQNPKNSAIQLALAEGAVRAFKGYAEGGRLDDTQKAFKVLQEVAERHPKNAEIQLMLAKGAFNAIKVCDESGRVDDMQEAFDFLDEVAKEHPKNVGIQLAWSMGAVNAIKVYGESGRVDDMEEVFDFLSEVATQNPKNVGIQLALGMGAVRAFKGHAQSGRVDDMEEVFDFLDEVAKEHPKNVGIQLAWSMGAFNAISYYGESKRLDDMQKAFEVLIRVADSFPELPDKDNLVMRAQPILQHMNKTK